MREKNDQENNYGSDPEQHDTDRAALPALISATIQQHESKDQKNDREGKKPTCVKTAPKRSAPLDPLPREIQTASSTPELKERQ